MKRILLAGIAVAALAVPAVAQTTVTTTTGVATGATLTIAPEQRTRIKQYVVQHKPRTVMLKERVAVGATLPADVELVTVPDDWGSDLVRYRYVYHNDDVILVEPSSRRVIQVID